MRCFKPIQTLQDPHCHTENHRTSKPESWNSESTSPLKIATTPQKQKPGTFLCSPEVFFRPMAMSSFHRPRVYRSIGGCCICRAKSSSSRFTTSDKYENVFQACFRLPSACPRRSGEICNACVLLVKRYQKLPINSTRHWAHVVDARAGPGVKNFVKVLILLFLSTFSCTNFFKGATSRELSGAGLETKACVPTPKEGREQLDLFGRGRPLRRWIPDRIPRIPDHFGQRARG